MPFPLGEGVEGERRVRGGGGGGFTCKPLPNKFLTRLMAKGTPIEASIPIKPPY